jgi:hypothetical protein
MFFFFHLEAHHLEAHHLEAHLSTNVSHNNANRIKQRKDSWCFLTRKYGIYQIPDLKSLKILIGGEFWQMFEGGKRWHPVRFHIKDVEFLGTLRQSPAQIKGFIL